MTTASKIEETGRLVPTARQWGLRHGAEAVAWMRSSGTATRLLDDICTATTGAVETATAWQFATAQQILDEFPRVLSQCDSLAFNYPAQALAYLAVHLPDRYCRVFQVLEQLLVRGMLPLGRGNKLAAIDIGAGPGPGIFAVRSFYAALAQFAGRHESGWPISVLGHTAVVERSQGMSWAMHHFAENLVTIERGQDLRKDPASAPHHSPNPCSAELAASRTPFGASHQDFTTLDVRNEHERARRRLARELDDELELGRSAALRMAYEEPIDVPSAYALALMMNFLTTPDAVPQFEEAIRKLMAGALVPGGVVLVLGSAHPSYDATYATLDQIARESRLNVMAGFDEPLQVAELDRIGMSKRQNWRWLAGRADDPMPVQRELRQHGAADIYDESKTFRLRPFRVRVYRRGGCRMSSFARRDLPLPGGPSR